MARKKSLGNPLLIAAGTQVATQVVTDELSARRQRATEQRQEEKVQQQQDDLAANQIYAQQKGVDLASAHYLRRRRNRIIGYSLLGATVVTVGIIAAVKVYKLSKVSEEARNLKSTMPPSLLEGNDTVRGLIKLISFNFFPPEKEKMKTDRIIAVLNIADTVTNLEKLKTDYKTLTGDDLKTKMVEYCGVDTWNSFAARAAKAKEAEESGIVKPEPINPKGSEESDEVYNNPNNRGLYLVAKIDTGLMEYDETGPNSMDSHGTAKANEFIGWSSGKAIIYNEWFTSKSYKCFYVDGIVRGAKADYWVKEEDVYIYRTAEACIKLLDEKHGAGYGKAALQGWTLSGLPAPKSKHLRCLASTSAVDARGTDRKLVRKGDYLGIFYPEKSTQTDYAFLDTDRQIRYIPKQSAAIIL